ncbi:basic salivary proline-rich protein 2-like [Pan paniscus]|uniref:basic salivary proline-rich protein 2-like n=1 Tax=Pan paniscus TaxID=9597 RepID=UPI0030072F53
MRGEDNFRSGRGVTAAERATPHPPKLQPDSHLGKLLNQQYAVTDATLRPPKVQGAKEGAVAEPSDPRRGRLQGAEIYKQPPPQAERPPNAKSQTFRRLAANSGPGRAPNPGGGEGGRRGRGGGRPPGGVEGGPWPDTYRLSESSKPPPPPSPRGRGGGAGQGAALRSGHRRRGALRSSRQQCPGPEPESRRRGWPEAGRGGSLQHLPLLPLPAAQIKKQQKATNHPRAERGSRAEGSACGARTQQAARMAGRGLGRAGTRGPASGGKALPLFSLGSGVCSCRQCRLYCRRRLYIPAQAQPPLPPPPRARPGRSYERCPGAAGKTRTGLAAPSSPQLPPPRLPSLLPPPPSQRSSGHLDAAGSEAGAAAAAPRAPRALTRSTQAQLPCAPRLRLFPATLQKKKDDLPALVRRSGFRDAPPGKSAIFLPPLERGQKLRGPGGRIWPRPPAQVRGGPEIPSRGSWEVDACSKTPPFQELLNGFSGH